MSAYDPDFDPDLFHWRESGGDMTTLDQPERQVSRVKLSTTAKGDVTPEISVVEGTTAEEMERIRKLAVETYQQTKRDLGIV